MIFSESTSGSPRSRSRSSEWVSWKAKFTAPGVYRISATIAAAAAGSEFVVEIAGRQIAGKSPNTGGWDSFKSIELGRIEIEEPGELMVTIRPRDASVWKAINLQRILCTPVK